MPSGNFHYYLCAKLNTEATSGTQKLHCNMVKFRFTSLYSNQQIDLDLHLTVSRVPGYITTTGCSVYKQSCAHYINDQRNVAKMEHIFKLF